MSEIKQAAEKTAEETIQKKGKKQKEKKNRHMRLQMRQRDVGVVA